MKALVFLGAERMSLRDEAEASVQAAGEVLIRVDAAGICGSDLHAYHGHDPRRVPPLILGHEAVGRLANGRRVVPNPLISCGHCARCLEGRANLCPERRMLGMQHAGCFAEAVAAPEGNLIEVSSYSS